MKIKVLILTNKNLQKELNDFLKDRFKYYLKEKEIRYDIIDAYFVIIFIK